MYWILFDITFILNDNFFSVRLSCCFLLANWNLWAFWTVFEPFYVYRSGGVPGFLFLRGGCPGCPGGVPMDVSGVPAVHPFRKIVLSSGFSRPVVHYLLIIGIKVLFWYLTPFIVFFLVPGILAAAGFYFFVFRLFSVCHLGMFLLIQETTVYNVLINILFSIDYLVCLETLSIAYNSIYVNLQPNMINVYTTRPPYHLPWLFRDTPI